jgi:hypothetical protein
MCTVNTGVHVNILCCLNDAVSWKYGKIGMKYLVSSAIKCNCIQVIGDQTVTCKHNMAAVHPLYFQDLPLPNFFLFLQLKSVLNGRLEGTKEVTAKLMRVLTEV